MYFGAFMKININAFFLLIISLILVYQIAAQCTEIPKGEFSTKTTEAREKAKKEKRENDEKAAYRNDKGLPPLTPQEVKDALAAKVAEEQQMDLINPKPDFVEVTLDPDSSIRLVVDQDADSGYIKSEDYIQFAVAQDVYAEDIDHTQRCVVIPKDTKVYGIVDYAKGRTPFRIKGRARLEVYVDKIMMANGNEANISFSSFYGGNPSERDAQMSIKRNARVVKPCKFNTAKTCVAGRLTRTALAPTLVAAGAGGIIGFVKDDTAKSIAGLTLLQGLGNASGIGDMINQSNAALKSKHVFEARILNQNKLWVPLAKKDAAPKKDEKAAP
jgi:hypothetical protein